MGTLKEIENRHYKECDVVMLPTKDESVLSKAYLAHPSYLRYNSKGFKYDSYLNNDNQHLYITSDDQIKEGDWSYIEHTKTIVQQNIDFKEVDDCIKKIIATTNESLITDIREWKGETLKLHENLRNGNIVCKHLPQPSQSFIKKYCELGDIDKVLVEYEVLEKIGSITIAKHSFNPLTSTECEYVYKLKTDSHNTITIKSVKNSWTREEHVNNLIKILNDATYNNYSDMLLIDKTKFIDDWITKNL